MVERRSKHHKVNDLNNRIAVLLEIVLFAIAIPVDAQLCDFYNFSKIPEGSQESYFFIMDAYDESRLFRGILITNSPYSCSGVNPYRELRDSDRITLVSADETEASMHISHDDIEVEIYTNEANVPKCDFESEVDDDMKNVSIGQITTKGGHQGFYFYREEPSGTQEIDRETGEPLKYPGTGNVGSADEWIDSINEYYGKTRSGDFREVYIYRPYADFYLLIDSKTLLRASTADKSLDDCKEMFKNLNVTKVYYKEDGTNSTRYMLNEGDRLFNEGRFEESISAYKRVYELQRFMEYGSYNTRYVPEKVIDNIGIALNNLGRYNESLEWFDLNKPRSGQTWNIYGQLLESRNLSDEADYAFRKANERR